MAAGTREALVIGEALIDMVVHPGGTLPPTEHVGGSPANVAMGLARLGHDVELATHLGLDARGERVRDALGREGVQFSSGSFQAARTSVARAIIGSGGAAKYAFDIDWRFSAPATQPALVHTGSIALFLEPGGFSVAQYLEQLPPSVIVTLDPNVRPPLMPDHAAAVQRFVRVASRAHLVKLSDEDAAWLFPGDSPSDVATRILSYGPRIVVVTLGAAGAVAVTPERSYTVPAVPVTVVDTISAGDSFMAALASSLLAHGVEGAVTQLDAVLARAARAAAIAVSQSGANPPFRAELDGPVEL